VFLLSCESYPHQHESTACVAPCNTDAAPTHSAEKEYGRGGLQHVRCEAFLFFVSTMQKAGRMVSVLQMVRPGAQTPGVEIKVRLKKFL